MKYDFLMKGKDKAGSKIQVFDLFFEFTFALHQQQERENLTKLMNDMRNKVKQIEDSNWMFEMQKDAYLPDIMPHNI